MYKVKRAYFITTKEGDEYKHSVIIKFSHSDAPYAMKRSESDYFGRGGGAFFCIFLLIIMQIVMLGAILAWKLFNLDIIPDYTGRSNVQIYNITDYNYYHDKHHIHDK